MAAKTTDPIDILLEMGIDLDNLSEEEDYLSALMEATNALTITNSQDPRISVLQKEIRKVRKQRFAKARPELKRKRVNPNNFFDRKKSEPTTEARSNQEGSPIGSGESLRPENLRMPEAEEGKIIKREPDVLKDILGGVISILETLKEQNKLSRKREDKDRKQLEKAKRSDKEDKLEKGTLEKFVNTAKKLVKPVQGLFDGLFKFIKNVLIGRLLFKIIGWLSDPKNTEKLKAIGEFFKATWPALLAAFIVFKLKFGGFVGLLVKTIAGFIPKLLGLIPKIFKGVVGLAKLAIANPIAASVVGGTVLAALGAVAANQPGSATVKDPDDPEKSQMDEINESGGMRGAPMSLDMFSDLPEETTTPKTDSSSTEPVQQMKGGGQVLSNTFNSQQNNTSNTLKTANTISSNTIKTTQNLTSGGKVPGSGPNKDTVPAMLAPGEFVISRGAVQKYGSDTFAAMNAAGGGTNLPERMNGITYAVNGGQVGGKYEEKNEEQSSTVKNEMNKRREMGGGESNQSSNGGFFGGIKKFFGFGGSKSGEDEKKKGSSNLTETQQQALQVLAKYESGAAGYDAVNQYGTHGGRGVEGFSGDIKKMPQHKGRSLTDFTIAEIKQLQYDDGSMSKDQWIQAGKLHAVGAYQFIGNTLPGVAERAGIPDSAKFTPGVQDLMALQLMKERGINPWVGPSDKANAEERAIIERARTQPIAYDSTSGGGAIKSFGGGGSGGFIAASSSSTSTPRTKTLSSIVGGFDSQIIGALRDTGSESIVKSKPESGSSIEPPRSVSSILGDFDTQVKDALMSPSSSSQTKKISPNTSPSNTLPKIDAEAMISHEKIKLLGIAVG